MSKKDTTEIVPYEQWAIAKPGANIQQIIADNLGGEPIDVMDLDRIKVPSGGMLVWSVPDMLAEDGEISTKELDGVIIDSQVVRTFWRTSFEESGGQMPPDCSSDDGITGVGDPGGECASCPFAKFGSAEGRTSQACQMNRMMFIARPGSILPSVVKVPPTSLRPAKKYLMALSGSEKHVWEVVTRMTLEKDKSADGITYSKIRFQMLALLPEDVKQRVAEYKEALQPHLDLRRVARATADLRDPQTIDVSGPE